MKGLEFFRNVSIGQYMDTGSSVHRLTPATKYLGIMCFFLIFMMNSGLTGSLVLGIAVAIIARIARVPLGFILRGIIPVIPFLVFFSVLTVVFQAGAANSPILFSVGPFHFHLSTLLSVLLLFSRFAIVMAAVGLFTSVLPESQIAHGIEDALAPLRKLGFPVHELSMLVGITLRFIPIVVGELENIVKAQACRGADFGRSGFNPVRKIKSYAPLFVPVIIRTLERAEQLIEAMEARGYVDGDRSRLAHYEDGRMESLIRIGTLCVTGISMAFGMIWGTTLP